MEDPNATEADYYLEDCAHFGSKKMDKPTQEQIKECPYKTIRDWPGCFEDCDYAGTNECHNHKESGQFWR